jgi:hypothetical protein
MPLTVGWRRRAWRVHVPCRVCTDLVREGVTAYSDEADPPRNALCEGCYDAVRAMVR